MENLKNIVHLLQQVQTKISFSQEIAKLKGENFNIFSLLNMERSENITHSRFLAELLNPNGSHSLNNKLLNSFIKLLSAYFEEIGNPFFKNFHIESATVRVEKSIGRRDDERKTGGRVDIAIFDKNGYSIFIENKIDASDQNVQIQRYCNYSKFKCIVLYLTLGGSEPHKKSCGELINGKDYFCISYKNEIVRWLELCLKEATEQPILRENIKQYIILIKKLNGQLTNETMTKEVRNILIANIESAEQIYNEYKSAQHQICESIRIGVAKKLEEFYKSDTQMFQ